MSNQLSDMMDVSDLVDDSFAHRASAGASASGMRAGSALPVPVPAAVVPPAAVGEGKSGWTSNLPPLPGFLSKQLQLQVKTLKSTLLQQTKLKSAVRKLQACKANGHIPKSLQPNVELQLPKSFQDAAAKKLSDLKAKFSTELLDFVLECRQQEAKDISSKIDNWVASSRDSILHYLPQERAGSAYSAHLTSLVMTHLETIFAETLTAHEYEARAKEAKELQEAAKAQEAEIKAAQLPKDVALNKVIDQRLEQRLKNVKSLPSRGGGQAQAQAQVKPQQPKRGRSRTSKSVSSSRVVKSSRPVVPRSSSVGAKRPTSLKRRTPAQHHRSKSHAKSPAPHTSKKPRTSRPGPAGAGAKPSSGQRKRKQSSN